jgi:succinate-semialdehyde dehydrogenase / glutarate-semialdehyde dehydrogenase
MLKSIDGHYLTDEWTMTERTFEVRSPIDGMVVARPADCSTEEAQRAVEVAVTAFEGWRDTNAFERAAVMHRWFGEIMRQADDLADMMTREMGKPIRESRGEVAYAAGFVEWYAEEAKRVYGTWFPSHRERRRALAIRQPVGPVYGVTPWNFPAAMVTRKAAPALAAGCTVILKPAEQSPATALALAALWRDVGGPAGTLQVLTAHDPVPVTRVMMDDVRIRKVTFTGSTEVGRILYRQSADTVKRLSLELGGHAPFLVFDDADLEQVVAEVMACKFRNGGQTCVCTNRVYVQESLMERFSEALVTAVEGLHVGDPRDTATDVGPLVDAAGLAKVEEHVADAIGRGARLRTGGRPLGGLAYAPTVLEGVTDDMRLMREETFGPVAPLIPFASEDEGVRLANASPFGLAAYLYTRDLSRAIRVSERLETGIVGVNDGVPSVPYAPFGGVKQSGIGREGGPWGIDEFLDTKYISIGLAD